jgi:hypothetical protein
LDFGEDGFVGGFVGWVAARLLVRLCSLVPLGDFFMKFNPILKKFQIYSWFEIICMGYPFGRASSGGAIFTHVAPPHVARPALPRWQAGVDRVAPLHAARRAVTAYV